MLGTWFLWNSNLSPGIIDPCETDFIRVISAIRGLYSVCHSPEKVPGAEYGFAEGFCGIFFHQLHVSPGLLEVLLGGIVLV